MLYLKKKKTDSETQLALDFGHYPPNPLRPMKIKNQFDLAYIGTIAGIFYGLKLTFSVFTDKSLYDHPAFTEFKKHVSNLKEQFHTFTTNLNNSFLYLKWIPAVVLLICFSPILALICLYLLVHLIYKMDVFRRNLGLYLPNLPSQISIFPNALKKMDKSWISEDGIISHEHTHMLQHIYFSDRYVRFSEEKGDVLKRMLKNPEQDFAFCSYHLIPDEMEARLHEVILSYYRQYEELPIDYYGFVGLLLGIRDPEGDNIFSKLTTKMVNKAEIDTSNLGIYCFEVRSRLCEFEMVSAILKLVDPDRYILEVLPVMYGNLLILYGDTDQAEKYFETLGGCELYKELYGEIVIPSIEQDAQRGLQMTCGA